MILNLITLSTVKTQLGIDSTTFDARLTALIPIVSSDVRRILNNSFDQYCGADFDSSSTDIALDFNSTYDYVSGSPSFDMGQVVYHPNIPQDTYITAYNPETGKYTLSATPTGSGDYIYPSVHIAQWPTISKMIYYRLTKQTTDSVEVEKLKSYSIGPVSKTYADSEISSQYNYPKTLIDDLGVPFAVVG